MRPVPCVNPFVIATSFLGSLGFARRIARQHARPLGANPRRFIATYMNEKFAVDTLPGWAGSMMYRYLHGPMPQALHSWRVEPTLLLRVSPVMQNVHLWLQYTSTAQILPALVQSMLRRQQAGTGHHVRQPLPLCLAQGSGAAKTAWHSMEKVHRMLLARGLTLHMKAATAHGADMSGFPTPFRWLTFSGGLREAVLPPTIQPPSLTYVFNKVVVERTNRALMPFAIGSPFRWRREANPFPVSTPALPRLWERLGMHSIFQYVTAASTPVRHNALRTGNIYGTGEGHANGRTRLDLPSLSYVFTHALRPRAEEQPVVKHVQEKDVVEIARKEVHTLMSARSPMPHLSRTDYARLADHVYAALMRRLLVEKERLGLHWKA